LEPTPPETADRLRAATFQIIPIQEAVTAAFDFGEKNPMPPSACRASSPLILAQTGCDGKSSLEEQRCKCLFWPAAIAAGRKFKPPAWRVAC
jgi:hypothetical protein